MKISHWDMGSEKAVYELWMRKSGDLLGMCHAPQGACLQKFGCGSLSGLPQFLFVLGGAMHIPRVILAGTNSGCGKTTVTCGILQALVNRQLKVGAFKCGPDYIDTMFHSRITGSRCTNLDLYLFSENTTRYLLAKNGRGRDINVVEGVMGFYDGLSMTSPEASTYAVSQATRTPVVIVVGAKGAALSVLATIQGFLTLYPDNRIQGVILNQCSPMVYAPLAKAIEERFHIKALGCLPPMPDCALESRHLGLVTAAEVENLKEKLQAMGQQTEKYVDLDGLIALADQAEELEYEPVELAKFDEPVRIAVSRDNAFCFYYEDSLEALGEMGAQLVPFSPLADEKLPDNIQGLYLCGGYPELYAKELSENTTMIHSVREAIAHGLPTIAECGGFMYLNQEIAGVPMVGAVPGTCFDNGRLTRFGYVTLRAKGDNLLCKAGEEIRGHEFHHWDSTEPGADFTALKPSGKRSWDCAVVTDTLYAGYPHFHFYSNPVFAKGFYETCLKEKRKHD